MAEQKKPGKKKFACFSQEEKRELLRIFALFTEEIVLSLRHAIHVRKQQSQIARTEKRIHPGCTENKL